MKNIVILLFCCFSGFAQKITISGFVSDSLTGEKLIATNLVVQNKSGFTQTDKYGYFNLNGLSMGDKVKVSYVGYEPSFITVRGKQTFQILLRASSTLNEVSVTAKRNQEEVVGLNSISIEKIKSIPAFLGEVDIMKSLTFIPGVMGGVEGSAGIFIRGGTPDQNLVLLDDAPIYNSSHLAGFFSVFNPNVIKQVDLYKGYYPPQFGGRLSSVIDITMRDGNKKAFGGEYSLGLINQNITLEGPLTKNKKTTFVAAGRYSNLGPTTFLVKRAQRLESSGNANDYNFYDLNLKISSELSPKDKIYFSVFHGRDHVENSSWLNGGINYNRIQWGNTIASLRYNRILNEKVFLRLSGVSSSFLNKTTTITELIKGIKPSEPFDPSRSSYASSVNDLIGRASIDYYPNSKITLSGGIETILHRYLPVKLSSTLDINIDSLNNVLSRRVVANEHSAFAEGNFKFSKYVGLRLGARYVAYQVDDKTYGGFEPRLSTTVSFNNKNQLGVSYTKMKQFVHLLTSNGAGLSNDIWVPSTGLVPPQTARQFSADFNHFGKKIDKITVGVYKKWYTNQIDYPEGTNFIGNLSRPWDEAVEKNGIGEAMGFEVLLEKKVKKWDGTLAYTLSKSDRQFENINLGNRFPMKYDRRHNLTSTLSYKFNKKWTINSAFIFQTGHATTLPVASYEQPDGAWTLVYNGRNIHRMPNYNRLDLGFSRKSTTRKKNEGTLSFGAYNAYNKANPYFLDMRINYATNQMELRQYSLIPFLPYVSYGVKF